MIYIECRYQDGGENEGEVSRSVVSEFPITETDDQIPGTYYNI